MHLVNGHPLDNPALGWRETGKSDWTAEINWDQTSVTIPGHDGDVAVAGRRPAPSFTLGVDASYASLEALQTLMSQTDLVLTRLDRAGTLRIRVDSFSAERITHTRKRTALYEVTIIVTAPGVWYRDAETTETTSLTTATRTVSVFAGISGKVVDSVVRLTDCTDPRVADSGGSFFGFTGTIPAGSFLRFDTRKGIAWMTTTDTWSGGTEVDSSLLSLGPRPHFLAITPEFALNPSARRGKLTVTSSARGSTAAISVRGQNAYVI